MMKSPILMYLVSMDNLQILLFIHFSFFCFRFCLYLVVFVCIVYHIFVSPYLFCNAYFACRNFLFEIIHILLYSRFQIFVFLVKTSFENVMMDYNVYIVDFIYSWLSISVPSHSIYEVITKQKNIFFCFSFRWL